MISRMTSSRRLLDRANTNENTVCCEGGREAQAGGGYLLVDRNEATARLVLSGSVWWGGASSNLYDDVALVHVAVEVEAYERPSCRKQQDKREHHNQPLQPGHLARKVSAEAWLRLRFSRRDGLNSRHRHRPKVAKLRLHNRRSVVGACMCMCSRWCENCA